jgi:non-specific serine/threonine protein kinase
MLLHSLGFGGCLADDMGLGKTVQVLAFLSSLAREQHGQPASLLILPASLLANWAAEIKRFTPTLRFLMAHPSMGEMEISTGLDARKINAFDLVITTYGLAKRYYWIKSHRWRYVILDEAQAIKNPNAAQTRAVKKLTCMNRLILTGTPIENHLADLWSLFDFLNPGLLGAGAEFSRFCKHLDRKADHYGPLRRVIGPYILRRLKTDRRIISDLPDKVEIDSYAGLSKKQVVLYQDLVDRLKHALAAAEGIQRKGLVLASLIKFKQICNHPDQYLGQKSFAEEDSGKFQRLREICETIFEKRERALIFTQFRELTAPLDGFLTTIFGRRGLVLHGGTAVNKRQRLVADFQGEEYIPYFILSVKAGGTGLNLTAANHVIHFDRWWNPAVEIQATDRAFRIGQHKNVVVHKFITRGTVEEKIARMIAEKKQLSEDVIGATGEQWITEMNNEELIDLFKMETVSL